ncbi:type II secretion system F family protein [Thiomicrorhabdus sp. 6S3-12]|uniref:type II secretion system F family protein n=1 Tax=Thiomicrorhabdus sp. 6S3-12 TaxID=2819681 RepID=UPI001AAC986D|nr:type II secretion system F family protein [Thiomicrorhabdus sp. 6S3-12]MBO1923722.1 type II secretion system F family protein [Thiomicrorhabdus sp. 6S3-12]
MQNYNYTGINQLGKRVSGVMPANNEQDLEQKLKKSQIDLLSYRQQGKGLSLSFGSKIKKRDIITITFQLEQMLEAGVPLMEIIEDMKDSFENDAAKEMLANIYESMEGGNTFSESLADFEKEFGQVYISLVSVGEKTGKLEDILRDLGNMMKWEDELASKAKKVMIYPAIVATVVIAVVILMMLFVVPELLGFITSMGGEIGFATVALIATSDFIQTYILELMMAPVIFVFVYSWWRKQSPEFKLKSDEFHLKIPIIGVVLHKLKLARVANSLSVMYGAGVSFPESLRMASMTAGNKFLETNFLNAVNMIEDGKEIWVSFRDSDAFPMMAVRMIKSGELTGKMDVALKNVSYFYDREAKELIEKIEPTIEPLLTVIMGFIVGWIMIAVLGPIYDTISQVQL